MSQINRGSEWNQWDLHIHTPNTRLNDQFKDKFGNNVNQSENQQIWKDYCEMLNKSGIKCFGITDYFSVDNYIFLKEHREKLGLNNDIVLFPNIELRVSGLVAKDAKRSPHKHVNVHVIFSNTLPNSELKKFLSNLIVQSNDGSELNYIDDYKKLSESGFFNHVPQYTDMKKALVKTFSAKYKNFSLTMIPNGNDGLAYTTGTNYQANCDFMKNEVDIIQSANPKDIGYFLNDAKEVYGKTYPCVSGSDAHDANSFLSFDESKRTWIKSETTFEGLKSIMYEPANRVKIRNLNPSTSKSSSKIISQIKLPKKDFNENNMYFNDDMNVIIGGRSSGKSLLLSMLSMGASGIENVKGNNQSYNEMIREKIEGAELYLKDGTQVNGDMNIEFFYQDKLQEIARSSKERNDFIENIIIDSAEVERINSEINRKKESFNASEVIELKNKLRKAKNTNKNLQTKEDIEGNIKELEDAINKIAVDINDEEKIIIEKHKVSLEKLNERLTSNIEKLKLINEINENNIVVINDNLSEEAKVMLSDKIPNIKENIEKINEDYLHTLNKYREGIINERVSLDEGISKIQKLDIMVKYEESKVRTPELEQLNKKLELEKNNMLTLNDLKEEINTFSEKIEEEINDFIAKLSWENFEYEVNVLSDNVLTIEYVTSINQIELVKILKDNFKTGQNIYKENVQGIFKDIINIEGKDYQSLILDDFLKSIKSIILLDDEEIYKSGRNLEIFLNNLTNLIYVQRDYQIKYEKQNFDKMSEGKKAFVLLLIKLKIGEEDCPILIDQPEDNLDNRSITKDLVEYLKDEKIKRQMFIVTHNANVAIGADSENIIIANEHDEEIPNPDGVRYHYTNGSLEDNIIKGNVCLILEGGEKAFQAREHRYNFSTS